MEIKILAKENFISIVKEGVKKPIESVIMIIPCQTPPLFLRTAIALRCFFLQLFLINWVIQVQGVSFYWSYLKS